LLRHHPWVFSGAIDRAEGNPHAGETVEILSSGRDFLGFGAYSPNSQIRVRVWTFLKDQPIDPSFFRARIEKAIQSRASYLTAGKNACRLINAESDGLPGLVVDKYAEFLVCQFLSAGSEFWKEAIFLQLQQILSPTGIYERSDVDARLKEGLEMRTGVLWGESPPDLLEIQEGPCRFLVDIGKGHKTGFYLDQRGNREIVADYARGRSVLNCFAYTGGFGIWALRGGAESVTDVESSPGALELSGRHVELNGCDPGRVDRVPGDVFVVLRELRNAGNRFDLIILDPPKFVDSRNQMLKGTRGYKDINLLAFKLLNPGGLLFTFSCSGLVAPDLFHKIVADAALDAGREGQILRTLTQSPDHPTALSFPEGAYLKGLVCRVS
ncbi:MAG: class I SAM-dependent methyltransferase, partial [Desulfobacterota bacterium]|nr:class I SAM-dependent methyltransferase [Thermodesulfobacteriota bacterium]